MHPLNNHQFDRNSNNNSYNNSNNNSNSNNSSNNSNNNYNQWSNQPFVQQTVYVTGPIVFVNGIPTVQCENSVQSLFPMEQCNNANNSSSSNPPSGTVPKNSSTSKKADHVSKDSLASVKPTQKADPLKSKKIKKPKKADLSEINLQSPLVESLRKLPKEDLNNLPLFDYLKVYQMRAVAQARRLPHGFILGFTMGLGKTLTMAAICLEKFKTERKPILVIVTKSTQIQTQDAFREAFALNALDEIDKKINKQGKALSKNDAFFLYKKMLFLNEFISNDAYQKRKEEILTAFRKLHPDFNLDGLLQAKHYIDNFTREFSSLQIFNALLANENLSANQLQGQPAVVFVTPSTLEKNFEQISATAWGSILVDEAQMMNNSKTALYKKIKKLKSISNPYLVLATGTPMENKLTDTGTLLSLIEGQEVDPSQSIDQQVDLIEANMNKIGQKVQKHLEENKNDSGLEYTLYAEVKKTFLQIEGFRHILGATCIRRDLKNKLVQSEWEGKIPYAVTKKQLLPLQQFPKQKEKIDTLTSEFIKEKGRGSFFRYVKRAARILVHPDLMEAKTSSYDKSWNNQSTTLKYFAEDPDFIKATKDGVVIFVDQKICGETIRKCLVETHGIPKVDFLTGQATTKERAAMIADFEKPLNGKPRVLILMIEAGGTGINFKKNGKTAIIVTKKFNPQKDAQAIGRILRAGSTKGEIQIIDISSKTHPEKHVRYLQRRKVALEKGLFPEKTLHNTNQNSNQHPQQSIDDFRNIAKAIIMNVDFPVYAKNKSILKNLINKLVEQARMDPSLLKEMQDSNPLVQPEKSNQQEPNAHDETMPTVTQQIPKTVPLTLLEKIQASRRAVESAIPLTLVQPDIPFTLNIQGAPQNNNSTNQPELRKVSLLSDPNTLKRSLDVVEGVSPAPFKNKTIRVETATDESSERSDPLSMDTVSPKIMRPHLQKHITSSGNKINKLYHLDEVRAFLGSNNLQMKYLERSYFKIDDVNSQFHQDTSDIVGKTFASIIPLQMADEGICPNNWQMALAVLEKLNLTDPKVVQEQVVRIRRNAINPMQARLNANDLEQAEPKLHAWLWRDLQAPLINTTDDFITERFKTAGHEVMIVDVNQQNVKAAFGIQNPQQVSYLIKFSDQGREHYDVLYKDMGASK